MSQEELKRLRELRLKAHKRMTEIMEPVHAEKRERSAEEKADWDSAYADFKRFGVEIEDNERMADVAAHMAAPAPHPAAAAVAGRTDEAQTTELREQYAQAFSEYLRRGPARMNGELRSVLDSGLQRRDMGEASGAAGGYLVPPGFLAKLTEVLKFFGGMRSVANIIETTTGQSLVWPKNDDTGNPAVIIGENTQVSELDLAFTQNTLAAWEYTTGAVRIGRALMQDSAFDLESIVTARFGKRFGRGQNAHFTTGTGTGQPQGIVTAATAASGVTTWDYTGIVGLKYSVDVAYRQQGASFMMSDAAAKAALLLLDQNNRPLWVPAGSFGSLATGQQDTLLGDAVVINNDLDAPAAHGNKVPCLYGDFKSAYIIRDVVGSSAILRLEERYADFNEVGFIGYARADGQPDDINAVRKLAMPA